MEFDENYDDLNDIYKETHYFETDSKGTIDLGFLEDVDRVNFRCRDIDLNYEVIFINSAKENCM